MKKRFVGLFVFMSLFFVSGVFAQATCVDSDGGRNYNVSGTASNSTLSVTDLCLVQGGEFTTIIESYCENGEVKTESFVCPYGCGTPADGLFGACNDEPICTDSDGGVSEYQLGVANNVSNELEDFCNADSITLTEHYCSTNNEIETQQITCSNGCFEGACIPESTGGSGGGGGGGGTISCSAESYALFGAGSNIYLFDQLNSVRSVIGDNHLPGVLGDDDFNGVSYVQRIYLGSWPTLEFKQQPTSSDDAQYGFSLSTVASSGYVYNATVTFESAVDFASPGSQLQLLELFGENLLVSPQSDTNDLVLFSDYVQVTISDNNPLSVVDIDGESYTVELQSATDTSATIKITGEDGANLERSIPEGESRRVLGLTVYVSNAVEDVATNTIRADIVVAGNKFSLGDNRAIYEGEDQTIIDGTNVRFTGTTVALTEIIIQVAAGDSDGDAIVSGSEFIDPVFGSFKIDFTGLENDLFSSSREDIFIQNIGNDKMALTMQSHDGNASRTVNWVINNSNSQNSQSGMDLAGNIDGDRIVVTEMALVNKSEFFVFASVEEGGLYEVTEIANGTTGYTDDYISLRNVFTQIENTFQATSEGVITGVTLQGKTYTIYYYGASTISQESRQIRVNQGESLPNQMIVYPTIRTSKGANLAFYEPVTIDIDDWDGRGNTLEGLSISNGDGYFQFPDPTTVPEGPAGITFGINQLTYHLVRTGDQLEVFLVNPQNDNDIMEPALVLVEDVDDNGNRNAVVVTLDSGYDGDSAGIGVRDFVRTWGLDAINNEIQLESNTNLYQDVDLWGTLLELDKSDSDQTVGRISYPSGQVSARIYLSEICELATPDPDCSPDWFCTLQPISCPASGEQVVDCFDAASCSDDFSSTISCNTNDCFGCDDGGSCVPFGYRSDGEYCDIGGSMAAQNGEGICDNSYECESNFCSNGQCVSVGEVVGESGAFSGLYTRVICRLANLFGIENYNTCIDNYLGTSPAVEDYVRYSPNYLPADFER